MAAEPRDKRSREGSGEEAVSETGSEREREGSGEEAASATGSTSPASSPSPVAGAGGASDSDAHVSFPAVEEKRGESELEAALRERGEYLSLAQRTQADFENYRKRMARESAEAEARGRAALAKPLLSVLDNLERAVAAAEPIDRDSVPNHLAQGVRLVYEELAGVLRNAGIESYEPTGEAFDPDWHEAMMTRPGNQGEVVEVLEKGYRLNGQVLRPARVIVGSADDRNQPSSGKPSDG
jgi:molecular chaperone GrpE